MARTGAKKGKQVRNFTLRQCSPTRMFPSKDFRVATFETCSLTANISKLNGSQPSFANLGPPLLLVCYLTWQVRLFGLATRNDDDDDVNDDEDEEGGEDAEEAEQGAGDQGEEQAGDHKSKYLNSSD